MTPYLEHLNRSIISIKSESKFSFEQTAKRIQNSGMNYHEVPNVSIFRFKNKHCIFLREYKSRIEVFRKSTFCLWEHKMKNSYSESIGDHALFCNPFETLFS